MDFGQAAELVEALRSKDETKAYQCFKLLEKESSDTDHVYPFFDLFADMIEDENSYVRTRGLLLIAANARWDTENKIDELIDSYLKHIEDQDFPDFLPLHNQIYNRHHLIVSLNILLKV